MTSHSCPIDRELFHSWLWLHRDGRSMVHLSQAKIAAIILCSTPTVGRVMSELSAAGKLKKVRGKYKVVDPVTTRILK